MFVAKLLSFEIVRTLNYSFSIIIHSLIIMYFCIIRSIIILIRIRTELYMEEQEEMERQKEAVSNIYCLHSSSNVSCFSPSSI